MPTSCNPGRRAFLGAIGVAVGGSIVGPALAAPRQRRGYADGMSFLPENPADVRRSGLDLFIADVSAGEPATDPAGYPIYRRTFELCDRSIDAANRRIAEDMPDLLVAKSAGDIGRKGRIAAVLQFQGCDPIGDDLSRMGHFRDKGLRVLQITHNESNQFATSYVDERSGRGLSPLGIEGVAEMNRLGLIPDVSHASEATALETVQRSKAPVILSHGACRSLLDHPRGATDRMIRAVAASGGVTGIFMMSFWLTDAPRPTPEHYVAHVRHVANLAGIDAVGVANDYPMDGHRMDGRPFDNDRDAQSYGPWWEMNRKRGIPGFGPPPRHAVIPELNTIDRLSSIHAALSKGGFRAREIDKIMGGNWARFFKENLR